MFAIYTVLSLFTSICVEKNWAKTSACGGKYLKSVDNLNLKISNHFGEFFLQMLTNSCKLLWIIIINNVIISNNWEPQMTIIVTWHWLEWALGQQHVIKLKWTSLISLFQKNWAKIEMDIFDMYLYLTKPKRRWGWHF